MSTILFYLAYIIYILMFTISNTYYKDVIPCDQLIKIARVWMYIILAIKILYDNSYSIKSIFAFFLMIVICMISLKSNTSFLVDIFVFIYSVRNVPIRDVVKITLGVQIVMMIFTVSSCYLGVIKNDMWYRDDGGIRYGVGYTYCTFIANYYFHAVLMYIYLKDEKKFSLKEVFVFLIFNYIIYMLTDTRAVYYLISLVTILAYGIKFLKQPLKNGIASKLAFQYCFPIAAIASIFISITYNGGKTIYILIDKLFSGRLILGKVAYEKYGLSFWGQEVHWSTGRSGIERALYDAYNYVDSSYLNILINYGLFLLMLICIGFVFVGKDAIENNRKYICLVLLFLAIHSMSDPQLVQFEYHPFLLMFGAFFGTTIKNNITQGNLINE